MEGDSGNVEHAFQRLPIEGLDVTELVREKQARHTQLVGGERVKHEGIVGIGTMSYGNLVSRRGYEGRHHRPARLCWKRAAIAAAALTLSTSAATNGYKPKA